MNKSTERLQEDSSILDVGFGGFGRGSVPLIRKVVENRKEPQNGVYVVRRQPRLQTQVREPNFNIEMSLIGSQQSGLVSERRQATREEIEQFRKNIKARALKSLKQPQKSKYLQQFQDVHMPRAKLVKRAHEQL